MILQNDGTRLSAEGRDKTLTFEGRSLHWRTLSEYSFQIGIDGEGMTVEAAAPVSEEVTGGCWVRRYVHPCMLVETVCALGRGVMLKTVSVTARQALTLRYARTEIAAVAEELTRGGEGQPLFVGDAGFIASTFPTAENCRDGAVLYLRHAPFAILKEGETFTFSPAVFGTDTGSGLEESVRQFILERRPHPGDRLRVYCDWGAHDETAKQDGLELDEGMALRILGDLRGAKEKTGLVYDYYLMDAFWYAPDSYDRFKETHWPDGPDRFLRELDGMGMKFGLWFDMNLQKILAPDKTVLRGDTADELCLAWEANMDRVFAPIERHIREHRVRMLKFDFAFFNCDNPAHSFHSRRDTASKEPAVRHFIARLAKLRREYPDLQVLAYNGFTTEMYYIGSVDPNRGGFAVSPFWAQYVDYVYCGDPRPAERPAPLKKSILHYTDCMIEQFTDALIPREAVDDHGTMIGNSNTIYYLQKKSLRDSYLLNIVRGTRKIHLYGETGLLDDDDWRFLRQADKLFDFVCQTGCRTETVLDRPSRGTVYGYSNICGDRGVITAVNVTSVSQQIAVNVPGRLKWKRIYHAGEWCDEPMTLSGPLQTELDPFGVDAYAWERTGDREQFTCLPRPVAAQPAGGYVETDSGTRVEVTLPAGCRRVGIRFLTDTLSPKRAPNTERGGLTIAARGGELIRLDTEEIWSGVSYAVYEIRPQEEPLRLVIDYTGEELVILHWQDMTAGEER